jgi:hypothetical protein
MSQNSLTLPTTGTVSGLQMAQDTNLALDTLNTLSSGASAPGSPEAGQLWHDTTNNILKLRSLDNTNWIPLFYVNESSYLAGPPSLGQISAGANRILNGGMQWDQFNEGASYSVTTGSPIYTTDQWIAALSTTGASGVTAQQSTDAPAGFVNSLKMTVGTGGAVASGDYCLISQKIEGNVVNDLAFGTSSASLLSLSFWVKSSVTGTFAYSLLNSAESRVLVNKFTIGSANTWTQIVVPNIPGDITGTWLTGTSVGLQLFICVACGSTYQSSTLGSWQAGPLFSTTSQTNTVLTTSSATFQLTGVMLNAGAFCSPFDKRLPQSELASLERYFEKSFPQGTNVSQSGGTSGILLYQMPTGATGAFGVNGAFRTPKRATPTITTYNPSAANANWFDYTNSASRTVSVGNTSDKNTNISGASGAAASTNGIHFTASARM